MKEIYKSSMFKTSKNIFSSVTLFLGGHRVMPFGGNFSAVGGFSFFGGNDFGAGDKTKIWRYFLAVLPYGGKFSAVGGFSSFGGNDFG